jgi:hypothetical protein
MRMPSAKANVVAADAACRRVIFQIGSKRIAYDFHVTTTQLGGHAGDRRAPIVPIDGQAGDGKSSETVTRIRRPKAR